MTTTIETKCLWRGHALTEKKRAEERGVESDWSYKEQGCLDCDGTDKTCEHYLPRVPTETGVVTYYGY